MENETKVVDENKKTKGIVKLYAIWHFCLYAVCLIAYYIGVSRYYGKSIGVYTAVEMVFLLFELDGIFYQNVGSIALGVLYIIFAVKLIKGSKEVSQYTKLCLKNGVDEEAGFRYLVRLNEAFGEGIKTVLSFMVVCGLVKAYALPFTGIIVIGVSIATYFLSRGILYYLRGWSKKEIGLQMAYAVVFIMALIAIFLSLSNAYIEDILMQIRFSFNVLFVDFRTFILSAGNIVTSALSIAILISALKCIGALHECEDFQTVDERRDLEKLIYIAIAIFVTSIICALVAGEVLTPKTVISLLKKSLPLLCACISLKMIAKFTAGE